MNTNETVLQRMRQRLADLVEDRTAAEAFGWGDGILNQIDSDIFWQRNALEKAAMLDAPEGEA